MCLILVVIGCFTNPVDRNLTREPAIERASSKQAAPYQAPPGFDPASMNDISKASELFTKSNIEAKQIWYFTAPASVPISAIEEMSLEYAKEGRSILNHKGSEYGFVQDIAEDKEHTKILIPSRSDDGYRTGKCPRSANLLKTPNIFTGVRSIDQVLHLQRFVKLPTGHNERLGITTLVNSTQETVPASKPVRQQPKGLQMRFRPIGFGRGRTGNIGSSSPEESIDVSDSEEVSPDASTFRRPVSVKSSDTSQETSEIELSSSESSEESTDVPVSLPKSKAKVATKMAETTLKRKHGEEAIMESKKSSSTSKFPHENKRLKRLMTKQAEDKKSNGTKAISVK